MKWHVWGDYVHTIPERIGSARRVSVGDRHAKMTARNNGFDCEQRARIGFEPWAAVFEGEDSEEQRFAFASYGTVRGWEVES